MIILYKIVFIHVSIKQDQYLFDTYTKESTFQDLEDLDKYIGIPQKRESLCKCRLDLASFLKHGQDICNNWCSRSAKNQNEMKICKFLYWKHSNIQKGDF